MNKSELIDAVAGAADMRKRAHNRWNEMLRDYQAPPLDPGVREELDAYVARRKQEIPDAWY